MQDFELYSLTEADDRTVAKATLLEASLSRMFYHFVGGEDEAKRKTVVILTASRRDNSPAENNQANARLRDLIKSATYGKGEKIGYVKVLGTYVEVDDHGKKHRVKEDSTLIVAPVEKTEFIKRLAMTLGAKFNQDSIFFATGGKAMLIYTRDVANADGVIEHRKGEIIPLGAFRPQALGAAYTKIKGSTFAFDWIGECFEVALDKPSRMLAEEVTEDDMSDYLDTVDSDDYEEDELDLDDLELTKKSAHDMTLEVRAEFGDGDASMLLLVPRTEEQAVDIVDVVLPKITYELNEESVIGWGAVELFERTGDYEGGGVETVKGINRSGIVVFGPAEDLKYLGFDLCARYTMSAYGIFDSTDGSTKVYKANGELKDSIEYGLDGMFSVINGTPTYMTYGLVGVKVAQPKDYNDATVLMGLSKAYKKNRGTLSAFNALDQHLGLIDEKTAEMRRHC